LDVATGLGPNSLIDVPITYYRRGDVIFANMIDTETLIVAPSDTLVDIRLQNTVTIINPVPEGLRPPAQVPSLLSAIIVTNGVATQYMLSGIIPAASDPDQAIYFTATPAITSVTGAREFRFAWVWPL
jgi:hypothetical protein